MTAQSWSITTVPRLCAYIVQPIIPVGRSVCLTYILIDSISSSNHRRRWRKLQSSRTTMFVVFFASSKRCDMRTEIARPLFFQFMPGCASGRLHH